MSFPPRPDVLADPAKRVESLLVDSLPYVDTELDEPGMREIVNQLILEEMGSYPGPPDGYASEMRPLPAIMNSSRSPAVQVSGDHPAGKACTPFRLIVVYAATRLRARWHACLMLIPQLLSYLLSQAELKRLASDQTSVTKPRIGGPSFAAFPAAPSGEDATDPAAWRAALDRARVSVEDQMARSINVELGSRYAVDAWKGHVADMDGLAKAAQARVTTIASQIDSINSARQASQGPAGGGPRVKTLARRWAETAAGNASAELAVADATREAKRLRTLAREHGLLGDDAPANGQGSEESMGEAAAR